MNDHTYTTPYSSQKIAVDADSASAHRESQDNYIQVIAHPISRWRIIICKHGLQWIVQKRSTSTPNAGVWIGFSHHRTRDALIEVCSRLGLLSDANTEAVLHALPERITGTPK